LPTQTNFAGKSTKAKPKRLSASRVEGIISFLIGLAVVSAIIFGYVNRHSGWVNPAHGLGYWLGIIGGSMMIILLSYPIRKRVRNVPKAAGSVGFWFRFHMLLGLMGPLAVLFHSRFTWGALNSAVALIAMIIVASSGLIGRFFYSRVHRGYSDRKLEVRSLRNEMDDLLNGLRVMGITQDTVEHRLLPFEKKAVAAGSSFWSGASSLFSLGIATRIEERRFRKEIRAFDQVSGSKVEKRDLLETTSIFFDAVRRAAEFAFYDRMLRLWHLLHLPLFFLLVGTAILHIVAVHMY
jgi:hypothetical protein